MSTPRSWRGARIARALGLRAGARGGAGGAGRGAARALRGKLLVRGSRHLRPGARRREAALPRARLQCRPRAARRHRGARARGGGGAAAAGREPSTPAGASARWRRRRPATTRCRYHNGSVWPHDNALIGLGFARYGHRGEAARLLEGLAAAAGRLELRRLPELFCGFPRRGGQGPTAYPGRLRAAGLGGRGADRPARRLPRPQLRPGGADRPAGAARAAGGAGPGDAARPRARRRAHRHRAAPRRRGLGGDERAGRSGDIGAVLVA